MVCSTTVPAPQMFVPLERTISFSEIHILANFGQIPSMFLEFIAFRLFLPLSTQAD